MVIGVISQLIGSETMVISQLQPQLRIQVLTTGFMKCREPEAKQRWKPPLFGTVSMQHPPFDDFMLVIFHR